MRPRFPALLAAAALLAAPAARAAQLSVEYGITLEGLALGRAGLEASIDDARYDMKVSGLLTGLAGAISGGLTASATARGNVAGNRLASTGFSATGRTGSGERTVQIGVAGGNVTEVEINPPFLDNPERVPLREADKRGIVDPLSGTVLVANNPAKPDEPSNCNRTVPVFDGTQRFNIVLSYGGVRVVRKPGYTGVAIVCNIRYVPVAGHRLDRPSVKFMQDNREMQAWLAPVEGTRLLVPLRISVQTTVGMTIIEAQRWTVTSRRAGP